MTLPTLTICGAVYDTLHDSFSLMHDRGMVGSVFMDPGSIGSANSLSADQLADIQLWGNEIGAYPGEPAGGDGAAQTMVDVLNNSGPLAAKQLMKKSKDGLNALGFYPRAMMAPSRMWNAQLNSLADMYDLIWAPDCVNPRQSYPIPTPKFFVDGGTATLSWSTHLDDLKASFDALLANGGLWIIGMHGMAYPQWTAYYVLPDLFTAFLDYIKPAHDSGLVRICSYSDSVKS